MKAQLRDYTEIEEKNCQLVTHYGEKKFNLPNSVTIGPNDEVVVLDRGIDKVIILDKDLRLIGTFGQGSEFEDSKLNNPLGVAVGHDVIAVSEYNDHVVKQFSLQGDYLSKFGSHGSGDGQFNNPQGLCFNSKGLLFVVDHGNCRVQVFRENVPQFKFGSKAKKFLSPCYIAVDSSDQVYVTDCSNGGGICLFTGDGDFIKRIKYNYPYAICITPDDHILATYRVEKDYNSFAVFNPTYECIAKVDVHGKGKGQVVINGIAINSSGTIFVAEGKLYNINNCLQIITS